MPKPTNCIRLAYGHGRRGHTCEETKPTFARTTQTSLNMHVAKIVGLVSQAFHPRSNKNLLHLRKSRHATSLGIRADQMLTVERTPQRPVTPSTRDMIPAGALLLCLIRVAGSDDAPGECEEACSSSLEAVRHKSAVTSNTPQADYRHAYP